MLGTHIALDHADNMVEISTANLKTQFANPTAADVDTAVRGANFPVTLPTGLPNGTKLKTLLSSGDAIMLRYDLPGAWRASHHAAWIVLANPSTIGSFGTSGSVRLAFISQGKPIHWRVGGEEVIVAIHDAMTTAELARMKQAMLATSTSR